ncbi:Centromere protein O [Zostera marina]|uniref:Centromere protein O n=1 Tax=Zostera marina TaxID=29655 RepID=A0A0K9PQG7_ZOSMR|nr:Centromere protein O [Zostera marina]
MDNDMEEVFRKKNINRRRLSGARDSGRKGDGLDGLRARLSDVLKRHDDLKNRLSRDSDKLVYERLVKEFLVAKAAITEEISLDEEHWNDGLFATIRERVHIETERKAMPDQGNIPPDLYIQGNSIYKIGNKVICCLEGARIGIAYSTHFQGEPCEEFHCVLESKSFLQKLTVIEHSIPFFLPIREAENDFLSSNAIKFIDYIGEIVQAYVDRREQVSVIKTLYENRIGNLYHSLSYNLIEFTLDDYDCKVTFSLRYADLASILPSRIRVMVWPIHASKKILISEHKSSETEASGARPIPARLSYAEDALRTMSLPQAFVEILHSLPQVLLQMFPHLEST